MVLAPYVAPRLNGQYDPLAASIRAQLVPEDPLTPFYRARRFRPLWITQGRVDPAASGLIATLRKVAADDLNADAYRPAELEGALLHAKRDRAAGATAEIALSRAYAAYVIDLHHPAEGAGWAFVDPLVRLAPSDPATVLRQAAASPTLTQALGQARRLNPFYERLRAILATRRAKGLGGRESRLLQVNLERARALPPDLGHRFILVNAAAQRLWFFDHRSLRGTMRVVVGARDNPTPQMIGAIRYALFDPSWNVPPDLVRDDIAPAVLRHGPSYLQARRFQPMTATPVDWMAVADGAASVRVRQLPGPGNVMGRVKFMLPNPLGIYLHDTPNRGLFHLRRRDDSHGCVRLQHPEQLAAWLFDHPVIPDGRPDQEVDLAAPVPVYIVYFTAVPTAHGQSFLPDIYGRDTALSAELAAREAIPTKSLVDGV